MSKDNTDKEFKQNPLLERFLQDFSKAEIPYNEYGTSNPETGEHSKLLAITDSFLAQSESSIMQEEGRISLAYEMLHNIPFHIAENFADRTQILDLSHNNIKDLSFLSNFKQLHTLILDQNHYPEENTLPYLPRLQILWLNNCEILDISKWIYKLQAQCPNIKQLSLMGNPGASTVLNGATILEHNDYIMFIISLLPTLEYLDDCAIVEGQKRAAKANKNAYIRNGVPMRFRNKFGSRHIYNIFRCDERNRRHNTSLNTSFSDS